MNVIIKNNVGKYLYTIGLLLLFPIIILNNMKIYDVSNVLCATLMILCIFANLLYLKYNSQNAFELLVFWGIIAIFWYTNLFYRIFKLNVTDDIVGFIGAIIILIILYQNLYNVLINVNIKKTFLKSYKTYIIDNVDIIILCILFVVLNYDIYNLWIKSDGYIYYNGALQNIGKWAFDVKTLDKLQLAGHMTYGYSILWHIGLMVFGRIGVRIINIIMALFTILCLKKIIIKIFPESSSIVRALLLSICTFSPLFFGISYEISADYASFCYFIWLICAWLYSKRIMAIYLAIGFCFTKESSPFILFGFLLGEFLIYIMECYKCKKLKKIIIDYMRKSMFYLSYAGILFVVSFITNSSGWSQIGRDSISAGKNSILTNSNSVGKVGDTFRFDLEYIWVKIKEMYIMNFMWIPTIIILALCIGIFAKKIKICNRMNKKILVPLVTSYVVFVLFNFLFFTYANYRYIQLDIFFVTIFLGYTIQNCIRKEKIKKIILLSILALFFVENYVVVDPLTYALFDKVNVGKIDVVTTKTYAYLNGKFVTKKESNYVKTQVFFDSMLYNRQQISLEKITEMAFKKIDYQEGKLIILPPIFNGDTSYTFRGLYGREDMNSYYWDSKKKNITDNPKDIPISFVDYYDYINNDIYNDSIVYYLDYPYKSGFKGSNAIINITDTLSEEDVEYMGWTMKILNIRKKC